MWRFFIAPSANSSHFAARWWKQQRLEKWIGILLS
jgi:hypothetical protein